MSYMHLLAAAGGTVPWDFQVDNEALGTALRLVKLCRVLRVFKMTRQFPSSRLILDTLIFSADALMVPMFFLVVFVLIFASMTYFLEVRRSPVPWSLFCACAYLLSFSFADPQTTPHRAAPQTAFSAPNISSLASGGTRRETNVTTTARTGRTCLPPTT